MTMRGDTGADTPKPFGGFHRLQDAAGRGEGLTAFWEFLCGNWAIDLAPATAAAGWFERTASPATVKAIYRFKTDRISVEDEFEPSADW
jgi:hypothetical protein